jgi:hypothetical protein
MVVPHWMERRRQGDDVVLAFAVSDRLQNSQIVV